MPRSVKKGLKGQKRIVDKETFDFSTPSRSVNARPVDPYEQQAPSAKAKNIIDFIDNFKSAGRSVTQANEVYKADQKEKGAATKRRGEEAPTNSHWAFLEGYENLDGEVGTGGFKIQVDKLMSESADMPVDEFEGSLDKLFVDSINGRSDSYIKGFFPKAKHYIEQAEQTYTKQQKTKLVSEHRSKLTSKFRDDLSILYSKDSELSFSERAEELHAALVSEQSFAERFKLGSKKDVSDVFVDTLISNATISGNTPLLDAFTIEDKHGIRLMDVEDYSGKIIRGKIAAENTKAANDNAAIAAEKVAQKKIADNVQRVIHESIADNNMTKARAEILAYERFIPPATFGKMLAEVDKGADASSFGKYTNADDHNYLFNKACSGQLTPEDQRKYRLKLTKDDYMKIGEVDARAKASAAKSGSTIPKYMKKANEYKKILRTLVTGDKLVELYKLPEKIKIAKATHLWNLAIQEELITNGAKNLDFTFYYKKMTDIAKIVVSGDKEKPATKPTGGHLGHQVTEEKEDKTLHTRFNK